jgi:hypothetical protein
VLPVPAEARKTLPNPKKAVAEGQAPLPLAD